MKNNLHVKSLTSTLTIISCLISQPLLLQAQNKTVEPPEIFTINCSACHHLKQVTVGPSLVEIAKLYKKDEAAFMKWCVSPGKKRANMAQMPSMAHISESDLKLIRLYILKATGGVKQIEVVKTDAYAKTATMTARPRIIRTFIPDSGPSSIYIALPTEGKHNVAWDADLCRLRYITTGEPNAWEYYKENGNALATMGETCYTEKNFIFTGETKPKFKGYRVKDSLPTFIYTLGEIKITEQIRMEKGAIQRVITGSPTLPKHLAPNHQSEQMQTSSSLDQQTLTITHTPK